MADGWLTNAPNPEGRLNKLIAESPSLTRRCIALPWEGSEGLASEGEHGQPS